LHVECRNRFWNAKRKEHPDNKKWQRQQQQKRQKDEAYKATFNACQRRRNAEIRKQVIDAYGGKCVCCGIDNIEFLAIDHINGGGNAHRKELKTIGGKFFRWIVKNNFPTDLRVLCHNCNMAYGLYGYCPHQPSANADVNAALNIRARASVNALKVSERAASVAA